MSRAFVHFRSPAVVYFSFFCLLCFLFKLLCLFMTKGRVLKFKMKDASSNDEGDMRICIKVRLRG